MSTSPSTSKAMGTDNAVAITNAPSISPSTTVQGIEPAAGREGDVEEQRGEADRIHGVADVLAAVQLTWNRQRKHLFVTWIHVPLGVMFLLVICWALRLLIDIAPFRFPAPVIAMMLFFASLLILDWLSLRFPSSSKQTDIEAVTGDQSTRKKKRFLDPVMLLLAPPCEFLLRNMSVMFTPSFILIPAREIIPGKEIGLLAAWFTASQILAFVIPVWLNLAVDKAYTYVRQQRHKRAAAKTEASIQNERRGSLATLSGFAYEKGVGFNGGDKLSAIATGLSGLTAHVIAPVTHVTVVLDPDERRQLESTALEAARQQGDPALTRPQSRGRPGSQGKNSTGPHRRPHSARTALAFDAYHPVSDVSDFHHHPRHRQDRVTRSTSRRSLRSLSREHGSRPGLPVHASEMRDNSKLATERPPLRGAMSLDSGFHHAQAPRLPEISLDQVLANHLKSDRPSTSSTHQSDQRRTTRDPTVKVIESSLRPTSTAHHFDTAGASPLANAGTTYNDDDIRCCEEGREGDATAVPSPRRSEQGSESGEKRQLKFADGAKLQDGKHDAEAHDGHESDSDGEDEGEEETAVERLACWFGDLITPTIYAITFVVGIPLYFLSDFALPLFLAINLLTFIAAITIVPPKIRRFLHPILSTSIATVLLIWAFAAMKGLSLNEALNRYYSVDARYSVLWSPSGYSGPVPGAGDILFSTLDAGIVALAIPMYRYRRELWLNLSRMMIILIPCAALSLFFWNLIARLIGMDPSRSLAFTARFMSTPLAIELAGNVGADESITVILVVITGVVAAIFKEMFFFKLMRVRRDDYLTVGLTMGATSGAIGASSLISTPKTMAIASLGFVLFGAILLVCTAIPPIVDVVRTLAS